MRRQVNVEIYWFTQAEGGRKDPPTGSTYSTVAKFDAIKDRWPEEAWSVVIKFDLLAGSDKINETSGKLRFLSEEAPINLLYPGSKFELFEGKRRVAMGKVLT